MAANVVEATYDSVLGEYQKDWISSNVVTIVHAFLSESIAVRHTVPRLVHVSEVRSYDEAIPARK